MTHSETPLLSGVFGEDNHSASVLTGPNDFVLRDLANIQLEGDWRPEELRRCHHPLGSVAIFGNCLASDAAIEQSLSRALIAGDPKVLSELPGSYTTMLFEPHQLTVLADLANQFPFFYRNNGQSIQFSSLTKPLREGLGTYAPDTYTLAAQIAVPGRVDLVAGRSAVMGIKRLEAGHILTADRQGRVSVSPYETFQSPTTATFAEAAESLRAALTDAVRLRAALGYRMSADFSGGLDSTSAAFLMARELSEPLLVATRYSGDVPSEDLRYVRQFLALPESQGLFEAHEFERPAAETAYANLVEARAGDEPSLSSINRSLSTAYCRFLRERGSELHITGSAGDSILDLDPRLYLGRLARFRTYGSFLRAVVEVARTELTSPRRIMSEVRAKDRMDPAQELRILSLLLQGRLQHDPRQRQLIFGPGVAPEWLTTKACRDLADLARSRAEEVVITPDYDKGNHNAYADVRSLGLTLHGSREFDAHTGLRRQSIYLDNAVLRACLDLPAHLRVNPWVFKALLVEALDGLVPNEVTTRSTKGDYSVHGIKGLRAAHTALEEMLRDSRLADLGVINPKAVQHTLQRIHMGANPPWGSLDRLIAAELWLRGLDKGRIPDTSALVVEPPPREAPVPSLSDDARYGMPTSVFMTTRPSGAIALNVQSGTYHRLNTDSLRVLQALQKGGSFGGALSILETQYPDVSTAQLSDSASRVIRQLVAQGILAESIDTFSIVEGKRSSETVLPATMTRQAQESTQTRLRDYPAALGGLIMALGLKQLPFARQVKILSTLQRWSRRSATEADATYMLAAVQRLSTAYLGRVACLESSMATVLAAALKGRRVHLVLGTKTDPDGFHAWPEVEGIPISTAQDIQLAGAFEPIFKV